MTIAQRLDQDAGDKIVTTEMIAAAGGTKSNDSEYTFPDGSKCWICPLHGGFFDFGMGCCLPD